MPGNNTNNYHMVTDHVAALSDEDQDEISGLKREIRLLRTDLIDIKNEKQPE